MTAETITPNDDAVAACDHQRQLDHIDQMCHEIRQALTQLEPLLPLVPRALALLDPGRSMRKLWGGKNAVQERPSAPLHVGEAPEDSGPVGT